MEKTPKTISGRKTFLNPSLLKELDALGFEWNLRQRLSPEDLIEALRIYHHQHQHLLIPRNFEIPLNSSVWPEKLWGVKLGWRVAHIRGRGDYCGDDEEFRKQLDQLDFEWVTTRLWKDEEFNYILSGLILGYSEKK